MKGKGSESDTKYKQGESSGSESLLWKLSLKFRQVFQKELGADD